MQQRLEQQQIPGNIAEADEVQEDEEDLDRKGSLAIGDQTPLEEDAETDADHAYQGGWREEDGRSRDGERNEFV